MVKRGEFYINLSFLETWGEEIQELNRRKVEQPSIYSNSMMAFLAVLKSKGFDYRALEGIMGAPSKKPDPFPVISLTKQDRT